MYQLKEMQFNELMELNVKVKQGKIQTIEHEIDSNEFLAALKKNKFFRLVKSITFTHEGKQGFFTAGKQLYQFHVRRLGSVISLSIDSGKSYHVHVNS